MNNIELEKLPFDQEKPRLRYLGYSNGIYHAECIENSIVKKFYSTDGMTWRKFNGET